MQVSEFAAITRRVIAKQGFEEFQPSACFPARREIRSLAGVPVGLAHEEPAMRRASSIAEADEEFLVAFKHSTSEFKVIRIQGPNREEQVFLLA